MSYSGWITYSEASRILEVGTTTIQRLIDRGDLVPRPSARRRLSRGAVFELRDRRLEEQLARERAAAARPRRAPGPRPPNDEHHWLPTKEAATVLGVSPSRTTQLARRERIPGVLHHGRWWFRADQLELVAGARALNHPR